MIAVLYAGEMIAAEGMQLGLGRPVTRTHLSVHSALVERVSSRRLVAVGLVAVGLVALTGCAHHDDLRLADLGVELGAGVGDAGGNKPA